MTERLITLAVLPWRALSIAGFYAFALPQLAWKQWTR
jgi:hypothetical protein